MCHSPALYDLGIKLDFQGVLLLMWSATIPLIHYSFHTRPALEAAYLAATTVLASAASAATLRPVLGDLHIGHHRARLFALFGAGSFLAPIVHGMLLDGVAVQSARVGLPWVLATAGFNAAGMAAYSLKVTFRSQEDADATRKMCQGTCAES